jgi:hypothetical protein
MQVVAVAGLAQAGKSLLGEWIAKSAYENGMIPKRLSFAGALKTAAAAIGADKTSNPDLYRKFCQDVGNACRTESYVPGITGPDYWVNLTKSILGDMLKAEQKAIQGGGEFKETVVIFDDVRFMNELGMLREWDATTIFVDRGTDLPTPDAPFRKHVSEALAYQFLNDAELLAENFKYLVSSAGSTEEYRTRVGPYLPVWAGVSNLGLRQLRPDGEAPDHVRIS